MKPFFAIGLLGKKEASYNAGGSLSAATDGLLLDEPVKIAASYAYDGGRPAPPAILGSQRRVSPAGRVVALSPKFSAKGPGIAYTASVLPNIHVPLQIAGFDAAVDVTGGAEKVTYTPTPITGTHSSMVASVYGRGQLYPVQGIFSDLTITADGPVVPTWEFAMQGLAGTAFSEIALPAITYPALTIDPPKATNIVFTLGAFTGGIIRKFSYKHNRTPAPALDLNAGGHGGFRPGKRNPTIEVTFENTGFATTPFTGASTIDPYQLYDTGGNVACSIGPIGGTQYNKWKITAGAVQVMAAPVDDEDGPTALITLSLQLNPTTLNANDDITIVFT